MFPGRTLEELDGIDYARLQRSLDARNVERVEDLRRLTLARQHKATPEEYRQFAAHDLLFNRCYGREDAVSDSGTQ